ncbi:hypothetical protein [Nocardia mexicana]|uniref:hypothetical protein n=1 Tax=Nocardia mexicana TaxID=279262 RepID=UPI0011C051B0|nr:hypothetical protein [Nocardia mexicana]
MSTLTGRGNSRAPATPRSWAGLLRERHSARAGRWTVRLRGHGGYLAAAGANVVTFGLLFVPWLTVTGPDGVARANAFGRIQATTSYMMGWSKSGPTTANINGTWAILTTAAIIVMVTVVGINLGIRSRALSRVAAASGVATALFVLLTLRHLNSRASDLYDMTQRGWDAGGQIGSWIQWAVAGGDLVLPGARPSPYATTSITAAAMIACAASIVAAVVVVVTATTRRPAR